LNNHFSPQLQATLAVNDIQSAPAAQAAKSLQVSRLCRMLVCSKDAAEMLAPFVFGESRAP
jgi:hypothetical protein